MPNKWTQEDFVKKAREVHGYQFDYSKVDYVNSEIKVTIICKDHGSFEQTPYIHIHGKFGCKQCSNANIGNILRYTKEQFVESARNIHGDKYDYSHVIYAGSNEKVKVKCVLCNDIFKVLPGNHITCKSGCPKCALLRIHSSLRFTKDQFIEKSRTVHGDRYDYSKVTYLNSATKVTITCREHGDFDMHANSHVQGQGCKRCGITSRSQKNTKTTETFIREAVETHGNKYDYSLVQYTGKKFNVEIICKTHGSFFQNAGNHVNGSGCPYCSGNRSVINTLEKFVDKASAVHSNNYCYTLTNFEANMSPTEKIQIKCNKCQSCFWQRWGSHLAGHGCSRCNGSRYSQLSIQWLKFKQVQLGIVMRHSENGGEYTIPGTRYRADGWSENMPMTVFEFNGDYFHGNPDIYDPSEINKVSKVSFQVLYSKTLERESDIKNLGYDVIKIWESDWYRAVNAVTLLQKKWRKQHVCTALRPRLTTRSHSLVCVSNDDVGIAQAVIDFALANNRPPRTHVSYVAEYALGKWLSRMRRYQYHEEAMAVLDASLPFWREDTCLKVVCYAQQVKHFLDTNESKLPSHHSNDENEKSVALKIQSWRHCVRINSWPHELVVHIDSLFPLWRDSLQYEAMRRATIFVTWVKSNLRLPLQKAYSREKIVLDKDKVENELYQWMMNYKKAFHKYPLVLQYLKENCSLWISYMECSVDFAAYR